MDFVLLCGRVSEAAVGDAEAQALLVASQVAALVAGLNISSVVGIA